MRLIGWFLLILLIGATGLTLAVPGRGTAPVCSFIEPFGWRADSASYAVLVAAEDTVEVGRGGVTGISLTFWESLREKILGTGVYGQLAGLSLHGGFRSDLLQDALADQQSQELLVVPWTLAEDGSCGPARWDRSYRWLPEDSTYFVVGVLREPRYWKKGRPVLDVPFGGYTYPGPLFDADRLRNVLVLLPGDEPEAVRSLLATLDDSPISPVDFFSLYEAMPTFSEAENQPERVEERLKQWEEDHSELLGNLTVQQMLRGARAWSRELSNVPHGVLKHKPAR